MTATYELRRLLDERVVEWRVGDYPTTCTVWESDGIVWHGLWRDGCIELIAWQVTPAQAIDATLGRGTCQDLSGTGANGEQVFKCSECGCVLSLYDRDGSNNLCTSFIFDYPRYCPECGRKVDA